MKNINIFNMIAIAGCALALTGCGGAGIGTGGANELQSQVGAVRGNEIKPGNVIGEAKGNGGNPMPPDEIKPAEPMIAIGLYEHGGAARH